INKFDRVEYWLFDEHLGCASGNDFWVAGRRRTHVVRQADLNEAAGAADTASMCRRERRWLR
ncbi:MAG TPA: hypothetical protein VGF01_12280, partial [Terracidiphilus sp.]